MCAFCATAIDSCPPSSRPKPRRRGRRRAHRAGHDCAVRRWQRQRDGRCGIDVRHARVNASPSTARSRVRSAAHAGRQSGGSVSRFRVRRACRGLGISARASGGTSSRTPRPARPAARSSRETLQPRRQRDRRRQRRAAEHRNAATAAAPGRRHGGCASATAATAPASIGCAAVTGPSQINVSSRQRQVGTPGPVCTCVFASNCLRGVEAALVLARDDDLFERLARTISLPA